jgi:hypothetical protein
MPSSKISINNGLTLDSFKQQIIKWMGHNMSAGEVRAELEKLNFKTSTSSIHNFIRKVRQTTPEVQLMQHSKMQSFYYEALDFHRKTL